MVHSPGGNWMLRLLLAVLLAGSTCAGACQSSDVGPCRQPLPGGPKLPAFEVATVKPFGAIAHAGPLTYPGGRVAMGHMNLRMLLMSACGVQMFQVVGGSTWVDADFFNIEAKPPESSQAPRLNPADPRLPPSEEERQMLLALLIDRFQLKFHVEEKEGPVYLLERGSGGLKLNPPKDPNAFPWMGGLEGGAISEPTGIAGMTISMPLMAQRLSRYVERPVIDKTGITGSFDFNFKNESDPNDDATRDDVISSIITSVRGIGLRLTPAKALVATIVIDHAEKPSPN